MHARRHHHRGSEQDGAISIMAAVLVAAMVMATSLAVDVGRVAYTSRDQQGVTDRAVLDALHQLGEALPPSPSLSDIHDLVTASVTATLAGNEEGSSVGTSRDRRPERIEVGYTDPGCLYDPADPQPDHPQDFCVMWHQDGAGPYAGDYDPTPGYGESVTTVRVVTASAVDFVFGFMDEDGYRDVVKEALGTNRRTCEYPTVPGCPPPPPPCVAPAPPCPEDPDDEPDPLVDAEAGISIRSRLVELNTGDSLLDLSRQRLVQRLLGDLLEMPDPTTLSLVGFDGLADARVPLTALGDAGATVGTTTQLLDSHVRLADLFSAMASGATSDDAAVTGGAQTALAELATEVDPALDVRVGDLVATTTEDPTALLLGEVNALTLVMHAAMSAAVADGNHFVDLDLSATDIGGDLFGLTGFLDVDATLELIEAPQFAHGKVRYDAGTGRYETIAHTAQARLDIDLELTSDEAETLLGSLSSLVEDLLCLPVVGLVTCPPSQTVSISVSAAQAEAELAGIDCHDPLEETDITTIVTSDAVVATADGDDRTLVQHRDPSSGTVLIQTVPGEAGASVDDAVLTGVPVLDRKLQGVFGLLGIGTGTAYAASHVVDCDVPVLLPNP